MSHSQPADSDQILNKEAFIPQEERLEIGRVRKKLSIGIPKEHDENENRIALTPQAVRQLTSELHQVYIERGAGLGSNYTDLDYSEAGAKICLNRKDVFECNTIIKVGPFSDADIQFMKEGQSLFSTVHINTQTPERIKQLMNKRLKAFAFEYLKDENNSSPIVRSMSEIAGFLSITVAAEYLSNVNKEKGILLGGVTGISPPEIMILGASEAGLHAARTAIAFGAMVKVFDESLYNLRNFQNQLNQRIYTSVIQPQVLDKSLKTADVVIGALDAYNKSTNCFVDNEMVKGMKNGAVIVDLNIDNSSCFETSRPTNHKHPVYTKFGVIHYCVPNIASRASRTASLALSNVILPILNDISENGGVLNSLRSSRGLRAGNYIYNGILTNARIGRKFDLSYKDINLLMAAF